MLSLALFLSLHTLFKRWRVLLPAARASTDLTWLLVTTMRRTQMGAGGEPKGTESNATNRGPIQPSTGAVGTGSSLGTTRTMLPWVAEEGKAHMQPGAPKCFGGPKQQKKLTLLTRLLSKQRLQLVCGVYFSLAMALLWPAPHLPGGSCPAASQHGPGSIRLVKIRRPDCKKSQGLSAGCLILEPRRGGVGSFFLGLNSAVIFGCHNITSTAALSIPSTLLTLPTPQKPIHLSPASSATLCPCHPVPILPPHPFPCPSSHSSPLHQHLPIPSQGSLLSPPH